MFTAIVWPVLKRLNSIDASKEVVNRVVWDALSLLAVHNNQIGHRTYSMVLAPFREWGDTRGILTP